MSLRSRLGSVRLPRAPWLLLALVLLALLVRFASLALCGRLALELLDILLSVTTEPVARASSSLGEVDPHRMIPAYLRVVIIEILVLLGLWSFSWYFGS